MPGRVGARLDRGIGSLGRGSGTGGRRQGDRVDVGRPVLGGVYPRKGSGWGVQGEASYPDLLDQLDRRSTWQAWRKGMSLARSQLVGAAERWSALHVMHRDAYAPMPEWRTSTLLIVGFTSKGSPESRWTVSVKPRGTEITSQPVGAAQEEMWHALSDAPNAPRQRLLEVSFAAAPVTNPAGHALHFNRMLIGEVLEDSALDHTTLSEDPTDGIGLLCVGVHEERQTVLFDASRYWRRERLEDGRLLLRQVVVAEDEPVPVFRHWRHLTQSLTLSCNCPQHCGMEFARLRGGERLGGQHLFPQNAPSASEGSEVPTADGPNPEGVRRLFQELSWARVPGVECKHVHAVRWALGVPLAEPGDMPSPDSDYWRDLAVMATLEDVATPMSSQRFVEQLRRNLIDERTFSGLDATLMATSVGDCVGITPQRVAVGAFQMETAPLPPGMPSYGDMGQLRLNLQHQSHDPTANHGAMFGDWWVGRGTAALVWGFDGPGRLNRTEPAMRPVLAPEFLPQALA